MIYIYTNYRNLSVYFERVRQVSETITLGHFLFDILIMSKDISRVSMYGQDSFSIYLFFKAKHLYIIVGASSITKLSFEHVTV